VTAAGFDHVNFVASLPRRPGVYRMLSAGGDVLYVGKARHLRDRVSSYFLRSNVHPKVQVLVAQIANIEVTVTRSETEALILEYNLIKEHQPRYNVLMRDDKSFPYIQLALDHDYPRLNYYRGSRERPGRYFGPFPDAYAARETLHHVQKVFRIRNCRDSYFAHRSRPCLQYQIGRCSAPCVDVISREDYARDVQSAVRVLDEAAGRLDFEAAARLRDQLAALRAVQAEQIVASDQDRDVDVFAIVGEISDYTFTVMRVRGGRNLGTVSQSPRAALADPAEALASFIMQFYGAAPVPPEILTNIELTDCAALSEALSTEQQKVRVRMPARGLLTRWVQLAVDNAQQAQRMRHVQRDGVGTQLQALADLLGMAQAPERMECFDISHSGGEGTVASCVVFGAEGPRKKDYRRFNIEGITAGDDYGALRQALERRFKRIAAGETAAPDVLLIDGGVGQLNEVRKVLVALGFGSQRVAGVSKGADRRPGQERLHLPGAESPIVLAGHAALPLIQRLRDEAHRFAITGHRRRRAKRFNESILETVPGLGPAKRRALLKHFGGLQGLLRAGVDDFSAVPGVGPVLARAIYEQMHPGE
jgi:excinuclease ABC subunit C